MSTLIPIQRAQQHPTSTDLYVNLGRAMCEIEASKGALVQIVAARVLSLASQAELPQAHSERTRQVKTARIQRPDSFNLK